ncbi:MAG: hypothetical protein LBC51_12095 [Treponema sp.]|jgi:hypothetical protein|nr:hypothetical protein [Treponema sp.]
MADKLEWMHKHLAVVRYTSIKEIAEKENYQIRPDLAELYVGVDNAEAMVFKFADLERFKCAGELMIYIAHKRAAVWWGYRCVLSLMEELLLNPAGERDIATIGADIEKGPEVPEFAQVKPPEPDPEQIAAMQESLAQMEADYQKARAAADPEMLALVEEAMEVAFQEFKKVQGIHPMDLLKKLGERLREDPNPIDPNSPIFQEAAKLKAQLAAVQKDTVETIKAVLPPKVPAHQKKISDNALSAVYRWVAAPGPENAQRCLDAGNVCPDQPGGLLSLSAFWAFGDLMPDGEQIVPTPPGLAANGLTQTLLLCALSPGGVRKVKERYAEYFRLGVEVLTGANNWEATLADRKMPHERLPEPDWSKAQDKSAAEWQAEMGVAELPEEEKEKIIGRLIAQARGLPPSSPERAVPQRNGSGNTNGSGVNPAYKRWKPDSPEGAAAQEHGDGNENGNGNKSGSGYKRWKPGKPD